MYNEFYGLSEKPFELLPDPRFLFLTTGHREIIASMLDGIRNRKGFISIIGEVGTGKTTLIRYLLGKLEVEEKVKTVFIFHPTVTFKELLKNILLELDLEVMDADKRALLHQLNEYLTQMVPKGETLVVIIDEAQDLSKEVLGELGMLPKREALQVVFVGQPEFEDKLNSQGLRQLQQRIGIKRQIRVFSEGESEDYIDHRLRLVRSSSSERFTPKAISLICSHAQGIPRLINLLCDNALLMGYSLSQKKIDVDMIREVIKDREGPFSQKSFLSPMVTAVKEFRLSSPRFNFLLSKTFLIVLSFLCLGGLVLLIDRYFQPRPAKTWDIQSLRNPNGDTKLVTPLPFMKGEDKLMEIVTVKRGYTISYLTEKYYGMVNYTLMDFILASNPDIKDVHLILVNQKIKIPKITEESLIIKNPEDTYKVNAGTFQTTNPAKFYSDERALKGKKIEILSRKVSTQDMWYRVVIGNFDSHDEVVRMISILKEKGLLPAFGGLPKIK